MKKISRIALLSVLFSAPMFAMDNASTTATPTMLGKIAALPGATVAAVLASPNTVASYTVTPVLNQIAKLGFLKDGCFAKNTDKIGQVMVLAAAAVAAYQVYTMYNAEDAVEANEDFFSEDTN
jgi:uncharacterized membrane protein YebE (DUF533 family)